MARSPKLAGALFGRSKKTEKRVGDPLECLDEFVRATAAKGLGGLSSDYQNVADYMDKTASKTAFMANMQKNRYSDVLCVDATRVRLRLGAPKHGDYIHANRIDAPELENTVICTQGPLLSTVHDFWRMIFQERVQTILMLCNPTEDGKPKCQQYWPEPSLKKEFDTVIVTNLGEKDSDDKEYHTVSLRVELNPASEVPEDQLKGEAKRPLEVTLYRWTTWPDRGVPDGVHDETVPLTLLTFARKGPAVIHCSAGIGRTGSVMAIEMALRRIAKGQRLDFVDVVKTLRNSRAQCIQTESQYLYIHRVLVQYAIKHVHLSDATKNIGKRFMDEYDAQVRMK